MGNLLVMKCDYSPHVAKLRMYAEFRRLLKLLRAEVGEGFLEARRLCTPTCSWKRMLTTFRSSSGMGRAGRMREAFFNKA